MKEWELVDLGLLPDDAGWLIQIRHSSCNGRGCGLCHFANRSTWIAPKMPERIYIRAREGLQVQEIILGEKCSHCEGTGKNWREESLSAALYGWLSRCPKCLGACRVPDNGAEVREATFRETGQPPPVAADELAEIPPVVKKGEGG